MKRPHEIDNFKEYIERDQVRKEGRDPAQATNLEEVGIQVQNHGKTRNK